MQINVIYPEQQTFWFIILLSILLLLTTRKDNQPHSLNHSHTNEIKGIAILMVLFCHIGYFLSNDPKFLFPLSVAGGLGVNLFLFISGFGLAKSHNKNKKNIITFYKDRFKTIFIPMWMALSIIILLDYILLHHEYSTKEIINSYLGYFPIADLDKSINSPLWYFSYIFFYYLIFPFLYRKNLPYFSAFTIFLFGYYFINQRFLAEHINVDVIKLYNLHYGAFPLGVAFANFYKTEYSKFFKNTVVYKLIYYFLIAGLLLMFGYYAIHSGVGDDPLKEQYISLFSVLILVSISILKTIQSKFLILLGTFSYEIYLIHWPIMSRHEFIYKYMDPYLATFLYLVFFILAGISMKYFTKKLFHLN